MGEEADEYAVPASLVATKFGVGEVPTKQRSAVGEEGEEDCKSLRGL